MSTISHVSDLNHVLTDSRTDMLNYIQQSMNSVISILNGKNNELDKVYTNIDSLGKKKIKNYLDYCNKLESIDINQNLYFYDYESNELEFKKVNLKEKFKMFQFIPNSNLMIIIDNYFNVLLQYSNEQNKNQSEIFYLNKNNLKFPYLCFYCSLNYIDKNIFNYGENCSKNLLKELTNFLNNNYKKGLEFTINIKNNLSNIFNEYFDFENSYPIPRFTRSNSNNIKYSLTYKSCYEKLNGLRLLFEMETKNNNLDRQFKSKIEDLKNDIYVKDTNILLLQDKIRELENKDNFNFSNVQILRERVKTITKELSRELSYKTMKNCLIITLLFLFVFTLNKDFSNETNKLYYYLEDNLNYANDQMYYFLHTISKYNFTYNLENGL